MLHPFPASHLRPPILTTFGVVVLVLLMLALTPGSARAACGSSSPVFNSFEDSDFDAQANAPEILSVDTTLDSTCGLTIDPKLQAPLGANQFLVIGLDFDRSPDALERAILIEPGLPPVLVDAADNPISELTSAGDAGFTAKLDELGLPAPTLLGFAAAGIFDPTPSDPASGDETFDDAPELGGHLFELQVNFTQPPPPPPPHASAAPPPPPATAQVASCKVPKIKRLTVKKAKAKLKKAKCKYKVKGKGRVRSVTPKAGTRTSATVQVKARKKKRKKTVRRSHVARASQLR